MESAIDVMQKIELAAKKRAKPDSVAYGSLAIGDYHWQGDVCIVKAAKKPADCKKIKNPSAQLAPGNTQGSRHIISDATFEFCTFYTHKNQTPLDGPIIVASDKFEVTHPEHGHCTFPAGIYAVRYQRLYAQELKRILD